MGVMGIDDVLDVYYEMQNAGRRMAILKDDYSHLGDANVFLSRVLSELDRDELKKRLEFLIEDGINEIRSYFEAPLIFRLLNKRKVITKCRDVSIFLSVYKSAGFGDYEDFYKFRKKLMDHFGDSKILEIYCNASDKIY